jgi:hypothetical protein
MARRRRSFLGWIAVSAGSSRIWHAVVQVEGRPSRLACRPMLTPEGYISTVPPGDARICECIGCQGKLRAEVD